MIFEDTQSLTPELMMERKKKSKDNWVEIGADYLEKRASGWTQVRYSREMGIPVSTLQKALARYKDDIKAKFEENKTVPKSKRLTAAEQKKALINNFRSQMKTFSKDSGAAANNKSVKWFQQTIRNRIRSKTVTKPKPGAIYTFVYDAKHKDTLPYWDKFPLIIFLGTVVSPKSKTVMLQGLNLHYVNPRARQAFLEELLVHANTKTLTSKTKLNIKWSNVKHMRGSTEMIKNYLPEQIKGKIVEIDPKDWPSVIFMPTQQFMSKGKRFGSRVVWSKV